MTKADWTHFSKLQCTENTTKQQLRLSQSSDKMKDEISKEGAEASKVINFKP